MPPAGPTHQPPTDPPTSSATAPLGLKVEPSCKTCMSRHRDEIEARLLGGESSRRVSAWLETTHGETIRYDALNRHRKTHVNPGLDAARQIQATAPPEKQPARPAGATVTPIRPKVTGPRPGSAAPSTPKKPRPPDYRSRPDGGIPAYASEVAAVVADVTLIDTVAAEALDVMRSVANAIQLGAGEASFAQSALLVGMTREIVKATHTRHIILTGKSTGAGARNAAQDAIGGLKAMLANAPPPSIEGDDPDDADEDDGGAGLIGDPIGDLSREPRWADGEPETDPDREVVEMPVQVADPPAGVESRHALTTVDAQPAAASGGGARTWLWQPPPQR
jgi:hypothetical protein